MLCNLSGKAGKFQGNDWVVELNNLYTKVRGGFFFVTSDSLTIVRSFMVDEALIEQLIG